MDRRSTESRPTAAAACSSESNTEVLTCPLGSARRTWAPHLDAAATSAKKRPASGNSCTIAKARVKSAELCRSKTPIDSAEATRASTRLRIPAFFGAALEAVDHLRLNINRNHPPRGTHKARKFQREVTHARPGFEHCHALVDVRREEFVGTLPIVSHRTYQPVPEPPGTNAMLHIPPAA